MGAAKDRPADPDGGADAGGHGGRVPPEPSFRLLAASLAAQVQVALGLHENPLTKRTEKDLPSAKHGIAMLEILEAKTKGNLDPEEASFLGQILYALRMAYVKLGK